MRNLTITRKKSFVGCLGKMKVYIEDPEAGELEINGVSCRKLGILKNGETATFPISDQAAKVFVIADKVSRGFCNDYYPLSAGTEDVVLTGKNKFHPGAGNPFRFDGVTDPEVLANRKKSNGKGILILIASILVGLVLGSFLGKSLASGGSTHPWKFSVEGMTITLTDDFKAADYQGFTQCYESRSVAVCTLKEEFTLMPGLEDYTLDDYAQLVCQTNQVDPAELETNRGVVYFDYVTQGNDGRDYYYMVTMHKGNDAFWLVEFATPSSNQSKMYPQFLSWAVSITFE
jgi:hypothetical protein